jgi:FkbM family methyltransferase
MSRAVEFLKNGAGYTLRAFLPGSSEKRAEARTHIRRRLALEYLVRFRSEITFRRNGFVWTGPPGCTITRAVFIDGQHQDVYIGSLGKWIIPERPVIVNVGANIGDTTLPLTRTGKKIVAIEPSPETFARLRTNVLQNGLEESVICCEVAIADTAGSARLVVAAQPGNSEILGESGAVGFDGDDQRRGVVSVMTQPLVDLLRSHGVAPDQVALVWSDTQGFESQVVESGAPLWASGTPLWVEVWPKGLDCHGGTERFVRGCEQHFKSFLTARYLHSAPEPIEALDALVTNLKQHGQAIDILLLP